MSQSDWPPSRPPTTSTTPPLLPTPTFGILSHQTTYILILRTLYSNPQADILKVFNALFYPPSAPLPVQMTLKEWHKLWSAQTLYPRDAQGMQMEVENLTCRRDWKCYGAAGEEETYNGVAYRKSTEGTWEDVLDFIKRAAEKVEVVLVGK